MYRWTASDRLPEKSNCYLMKILLIKIMTTEGNNQCKYRGKLKADVFWLQDNTPVNTDLIAVAEKTTCGSESLLHLPYSPDLVPSELFLFQKLKSLKRSLYFQIIDVIIWTVKGLLFRDGVRIPPMTGVQYLRIV